MRRFKGPDRSRRSLLATVGSGAAFALVGCLGGDATPSDGDGDSDSEAEERSFPAHPMDEPREPPEGRLCDGPCGMSPSSYPESNGQIAHGGGEGVFFDSVGCLVAYANDPTFYDGPETTVETAWVRDFGTKELLDAATATFVLDYDKQRHEELMAHNPKPFAERADAVGYVDQYDDLTTEDIVEFDAFGGEQAHRYRDYPLDEDD